jgi:hypothetical protein
MSDGRLRRMWSRERQGWQRPMTWKLFAFLTFSSGLQGLLALDRGDRCFGLIVGTMAAASALLAVLAYKESHQG